MILRLPKLSLFALLPQNPRLLRCIGTPHRPLKQLTNTNPLERISDRLQNRRPAIVPEATEVERMASCAHRRRLHLAAVQAVQRLSGQATGKRWCSRLHASTARATTHRTHRAARPGHASSGGKSKYCLRCPCPSRPVDATETSWSAFNSRATSLCCDDDAFWS